MSLDFQQVRQQVTEMGQSAIQQAQLLQKKRHDAYEILQEFAPKLSTLQAKIDAALRANENLRCALPTSYVLNFQGALPSMPETIVILAADGSQINPDRHASADYCLVNVGAIQMIHGRSHPPVTKVVTNIFFSDQMYTTSGRITERMLALMRDLSERELLAAMAQKTHPPLITLTDGPLELWVGRGEDIDIQVYQKHFQAYLAALRKLYQCGASTAGYIDRPRSDLLVRLLEIAILPKDQINQAGRTYRPFLGVTDVDLFYNLLEPCERSAIFGIQTRSSDQYTMELALHFFYLNVSRDKRYPYLVRVEIPAWVANSQTMVNDLHSVLIQQCHIVGTQTYPYLLHRSHEIAVVTQDEKRQVDTMIALEMHRRGLYLDGNSHKQAMKDLPGRTRK